MLKNIGFLTYVVENDAPKMLIFNNNIHPRLSAAFYPCRLHYDTLTLCYHHKWKEFLLSQEIDKFECVFSIDDFSQPSLGMYKTVLLIHQYDEADKWNLFGDKKNLFPTYNPSPIKPIFYFSLTYKNCRYSYINFQTFRYYAYKLYGKKLHLVFLLCWMNLWSWFHIFTTKFTL